MDRVRFGRALGTGAREAARALLKAADAAAAPNPNAAGQVPGAVGPVPGAVGPVPGAVRPVPGAKRPESSAGVRAAQQVLAVKRSTATTPAGVRAGSRRFGKAVWGPFAKLSGVLWLEFTGVFFGLFALTAALGVWRRWGDLRAGVAAGHRLWFAVGMLVVFGYFSVSSFLRARRRGRG